MPEEPIMENGHLKYMRCGACDENNIRDWDAHEKTPKHLHMIIRYQQIMLITKGHLGKEKMIQVMRGEKTLKELGWKDEPV